MASAVGNYRGVELDPLFVSRHWPLTQVAVSPLFISRFQRAVFKIDAAEGVFAAKVNDSPPPPEAARRDGDLFAYLTSHGYPHVPALVSTRDGAPMVHTGSRSVVVLELVPVRFDPDVPLPPAAWSDLAVALARLNTHSDYPYQWGTAFIDQVPDELRDRVRGRPIEAEFVGLLDRVVALRSSTQCSLVHAEANAANSGRRADGTVVLLDWDGRGSGPTAFDYGYPLITQFVDQFDRTFHRDAAEAFYGTYADAGGVVNVHEAFLAGLFHAMFLMWFFNPEGRWARIQWAVAHEQQLCAVIEQAIA